MEECVSVSDVYICFADFYYCDDFIDETEYTSDIMFLEKTNYGFDINNNFQTRVFKNYFDNSINYYVREDNSVLFYPDEAYSFVDGIPYMFNNMVSLSDLVNLFKNSSRKDSKYKDFIKPIFESVQELIEEDDFLERSEIECLIGHICNLYIYVFNYITEEEYDRNYAPDSNIVDFNEYKKRVKKLED